MSYQTYEAKQDKRFVIVVNTKTKKYTMFPAREDIRDRRRKWYTLEQPIERYASKMLMEVKKL